MPRVDELLREEIGSLVASSLNDPRLGFVTIISVETTPDLRHAKVYVSLIGTDEQQAASLAALRSAVPYLRTKIAKGLRIKRVPALHFAIDESGARGARIQQLLGRIAEGETDHPSTLRPLPSPKVGVGRGEREEDPTEGGL